MLSNLQSSTCHNVIVTISDSSLADMFVYDKVKAFAEANNASVFQVTDKKSLRDMLSRMQFESMLSKKWVFEIDYSKVKDINKYLRTLHEVSTSYFLIKCRSYAEFKEVKKGTICTDIYLLSLKSEDVSYLFGNAMSVDLKRYLANNYSTEQIFTLFDKYLNKEVEGEITKKIISLSIGSTTSSIRDFVFSLLRDTKGTDKALRTLIRKRSQEVSYLTQEFGTGSVYNFITSEVKNMIQLKTLYAEGYIYRSIRQLPDGYDEERLKRYQRDYFKVLDVSLPRLLNLLTALQDNGYWRTEESVELFLYNYYLGRKV